MVREAAFSHRRRGIDESQVRRFLDDVATQIESADAERARLRAENESLRQRLDQTTETGAISPQAIALFSQAQQVADNLVAEAVDHARAMMSDARRQQREILEKARSAAGPATPGAHVAPGHEHGREPGREHGREHSGTVPEIEYVRTFAHVAQVQLRSVLEALTEQVDRLSEVPAEHPPPSELSEAAGALIDGPVQWRFERPADSDQPYDNSLPAAAEVR
jgi:cell division septum initiation protein DivIVA